MLTHLGPIVHHLHWQPAVQVLPQHAQQDIGVTKMCSAATHDQETPAGDTKWLAALLLLLLEL